MENKICELFAPWDAVMVRACVQGSMGRVITQGEASALACLGDFCFLAGRPDRTLLERADAPILVPGDDNWARLIQDTLGEGAVPFTRYAVKHTPEQFDRRKLFAFIKALPQGFSLGEIDKEMYLTLLKEGWARDLCGNFRDGEDFLRRGLGFVVTRNGLAVAGAASYAVCDSAIEIEIDTHPDFRRLGLATACGARLILECLSRNIDPGWDAHDRRSLSLAEKLGYQPDRPYTAYWVEARANIFREKTKTDT